MVEVEYLREYKFYVGEISRIKVFVLFNNLISDSEDNIDLNDLPEEIRNNIEEISEEFKRIKKLKSNGLNKWVLELSKEITVPEFEITLNDYFNLIAIKEKRERKINKRQASINNSIIAFRSINNDKYLKCLLQSLNKKNGKYTKKESLLDLIEICKRFEIEGYSNLSKQDLIDHLILNLSDEEKIDFLLDFEPKIIKREIKSGLYILSNKFESKERLENIKVINPHSCEINLEFKGKSWKTESFVIINNKNIANPERNCSCKIGENEGFCRHFWIGFFYSLIEGFFNLDNWKLTFLPDNIIDIRKAFNSFFS